MIDCFDDSNLTVIRKTLRFYESNSLQVVKGYVEPSLATVKAGDKFQFQRLGYFTDKDSSVENHYFQQNGWIKRCLGRKGQKKKKIF
jgi:glutaminyl-tRNA synthetase